MMRALQAVLVGVALGAAVPAGARVPDLLPDEVVSYSQPSDVPVSPAPWWPSFGDSELNTLVEAALGDNRNLAASRRRVDEARAIAAQGFSGLLPQVSLDANGSMAPTESLGFQFGGLPGGGGERPNTYYSGSASLNASLGIDLWGRQVLTYQASRYDRRAAEGDRDAQALVMASTVASAYFDLVAARERLAVVREQVRINTELLELVELRYEGSDASALDVLQQRQQLATTRALVPSIEAGERLSLQALNALLGRAPEAPVNSPVALPDVPEAPSIGEPQELLQNRPDLRATAERLRAAHARRLSTERALLPSFGVSASTGYQALRIDETTTQSVWTVGAQASVPIFQGGRLQATRLQAKAAEDGAKDQAIQSVRDAVRDVETALAQEVQTTAQLDAYVVQAEAAGLSLEESQRQFTSGLVTYLPVLTALASAQAADLNVVTARRDRITARLRLHDALGGAWTRTYASAGGQP